MWFVVNQPASLIAPDTNPRQRIRAGRSRTAAALAMALVLALIGVARAGEPRLIVQPSSIELNGANAEHGLLVTRVDDAGRMTDVTTSAHFRSSAPDVVKAGSAVCRAAGDGSAQITAEMDGLSATTDVRVKDATKTVIPSFRQDVIPLLTRSGCNAGTCHGKVAGQNGFRLSLRGYAPDWDYDSLTSELASRRIDFAEPDKSLLLRKPLGAVPHEGGRRFSETSREARVLLAWISARAPGPVASEADADRLEILPGNRTMRVGQSQRLLVRAHWPDGQVRDVTWLCRFFANDPSTVSVSDEGVVKSLRNGETSVRVHFQALVDIITFTMPFDQHVDPSLFAQKNNAIDGHIFERLQSLNIPP
jgi:hypothetical protein